MPISEKFCVRWNDFQENVNTAFRDWRKDYDFTDVTLACEDGHQVEAHRIILSASSPFFQKLLKRNKHAHPLIYMRGVTSENLIAIVDFLYYGEVGIFQENLDTFLSIAEELQLKGLDSKDEGESPAAQFENPLDANAGTQKKNETFEAKIITQNNIFIPQYYSKDLIKSSMALSLSMNEFSGDMNELDSKIDTMMGRGETMMSNGPNRMSKVYVCQVCGKEATRTNIKDHIEANHLEGITSPCSLCEKTFRSRGSLRHHMRNHK